MITSEPGTSQSNEAIAGALVTNENQTAAKDAIQRSKEDQANLVARAKFEQLIIEKLNEPEGKDKNKENKHPSVIHKK